MIVVGASFGGVQALQLLLERLRTPPRASITIALHRHRDSDASLIATLQRHSALKIFEAVDKQPLEPGCIYVGPADYHILIDGERIALSIDEPVRYARPSIDVLFESAAAFGQRAAAVVLSGGGSDGAQGAAMIESSGGRVFVQRPETAICGDMPQAALAVLSRPIVADVATIAEQLLELSE
jgi:two-component system chemotaxis response regulator CheB